MQKKHKLGIESLENRSVLTPVIAIIDSGIDLTHSALKDYIWKNPGEISSNGIDDDKNGYIDDVHGWNFANNNNNVQDGYGHGTHVAGIITSYGPVSIMVLKFQDDKGLGFTGSAISAINYAIMMKKNYGIDIIAINNSWGGSTGYSSILNEAIKNANDNNILFVASAGNNASDHDITPRYPSSYKQPNVISVASLRYDQQGLSTYSDYGKNSVHIAAMGSSVLSTLPYNRYGYMSGTSMAAPQITGAIAAICNKYGNLNIEEIKTKIFDTVDRLDSLSNKLIYGGSLNINRALGDYAFKTTIPSNISIVTQKWSDRLVYKIDTFNINRISGYVLDPYTINDRITIKILINNKEVYRTNANLYQSKLTMYADKHHRFSIRINRKSLVRGWNTVTIIAEDKATNDTKFLMSKNIKR